MAKLLLRSLFSWNFTVYLRFFACACGYLNLDKIQGKTWCYRDTLEYGLHPMTLTFIWTAFMMMNNSLVSWQCTQNPNYSNSTMKHMFCSRELFLNFAMMICGLKQFLFFYRCGCIEKRKIILWKMWKRTRNPLVELAHKRQKKTSLIWRRY